MALDPLLPNHTPKLPGITPAKAIPGKVGEDLGTGSAKKSDAVPVKEISHPPAIPFANNVQAYSSVENWSELPSNLFSNAGSSGTGEVSSISRISVSTDETDDFGLEVADTGFQILELDAPSGEDDEGLDGAELDLEVSLGLTQLDSNDRNGAQELASLMAGFDAFRQGQFQQAYRLDPNSFTAYKTIKS